MRSRGAMRDHTPDLKALRAAFTAASTSDASPRATSAITSPVAGLMVWKVLPFFEETNLPSMKWRGWGFSLTAALCSAFASSDLACSRFMVSSSLASGRAIGRGARQFRYAYSPPPGLAPGHAAGPDGSFQHHP